MYMDGPDGRVNRSSSQDVFRLQPAICDVNAEALRNVIRMEPTQERAQALGTGTHLLLAETPNHNARKRFNVRSRNLTPLVRAIERAAGR